MHPQHHLGLQTMLHVHQCIIPITASINNKAKPIQPGWLQGQHCSQHWHSHHCSLQPLSRIRVSKTVSQHDCLLHHAQP